MDSFYSKIGPEKLEEIVFRFYDIIYEQSSIKHLFTSEKEIVRDKQLKFLTQFLGGPTLYSDVFGHPRMKMRHMPHFIDNDAMIEWLRCMKLAIDESSLEQKLKQPLFDCFPKLAAHMVNR
jgi:hemoglobin